MEKEATTKILFALLGKQTKPILMLQFAFHKTSFIFLINFRLAISCCVLLQMQFPNQGMTAT
jgi:hypothetical protein